MEIKTLNAKPFWGTIPLHEPKHGIYKDCLAFTDFKNFDRVEPGNIGSLILVYKLKAAINVGEKLYI